MISAYRQIPLERGKRHFVFGDIHGRYTTFLGLLEKIGHDPATDVVYAVGDLIDRGPDSVAVVEFFEQVHCHAVRGNHEQMVLNSRRWREVWLDPWNGGPKTLFSLERHARELAWLEAFCRTLPVVLDVGEAEEPGAFRLVHAENPFGWSEAKLQGFLATSTSLEAGESRLLWGRDDVERASWHPAGADGRRTVEVDPGRSTRAVFCGHTPLEEVLTASGTSWIDTWTAGVMTCVEPATLREHRMPLTEADAVFP